MQMADIIAPAIAIGLCLGRIGCLLNGCCFGQVACSHCPGLSFPLSSPVRYTLVGKGWQSAAGFTLVGDRSGDSLWVEEVNPLSPPGRSQLQAGDLIVKVNGRPIANSHELRRDLANLASEDLVRLTVFRDGEEVVLEPYSPPIGKDFLLSDLRVETVEPNSPAARAGVERGDVVLKVGGENIWSYGELARSLGLPDSGSGCGGSKAAAGWPRGQNTLTMGVLKPDGQERVLTFTPWTLAIQPTQLYESISMLLLFLLLLAYYPFRRRPGELLALLMVGYGIHRYLNELLRIDERPESFESYISVLLIVSGLAMFVGLRWWPVRPRATAGRPSSARS
jgi:hypothetical protein